LIASVAALGISATAAFAQSSAGLEEYIQACASCHGLAGHGDGPLAEYMTVEVPDLTQISIANDGEFPMYHVISIIDGRTGVRGHGSQMPVWGQRYQIEATPEAGEYGAELIVRGRILALAQHLEAIQE
ncbi:MAG: cytochrome c, partial [Paracoccaceae bacterium]|nr:cytochrome c [Paracoccaceae bacterium]